MRKNSSFEAGLAELEAILAKLSDPNTSLADSVKLYAQAAELIQFCSESLQNAKLRIEEIDQKLTVRTEE